LKEEKNRWDKNQMKNQLNDRDELIAIKSKRGADEFLHTEGRIRRGVWGVKRFSRGQSAALRLRGELDATTLVVEERDIVTGGGGKKGKRPR